LKIGILSDTHGFIHPDIIALITRCDFAVHAGDIIDEKTLLSLKPKHPLIAVQGNNDAHLSQLKTVEKLTLLGGEIVVEHGHLHGQMQPSHASLRAAYPNAKLIIYGHTHQQIVDKTASPWVVNPGAAGRVRNHGGSKCMLLTIQSATDWRVKSYTFDEEI
jgi:putative phosphoesterase